MEATFFVANHREATAVRQYEDIQTEPLSEPLGIPTPATLVALATTISGAGQAALQPLRDATCQSYPIFSFAPAVVRALRDLKEGEIDALAERWLELGGWREGDVDLYELGQVLQDLRAGLGGVRALGDRLFILLEEKAW